MKKRILVIDCDSENLDLAKKQFGQDYELVTASSVSEARKLLKPETDYGLKSDLLEDKLESAGLPRDYNPWHDETPQKEERKAIYNDLKDEAYKEATTYPSFDIVMTAILMPGESDGQGDEGLKFVGQMLHFGPVIALMALKVNVPEIIICGSDNHHYHPITWAMDAIMGGGDRVKFACERSEIDGKYRKDWKATLEECSK